MDKFVTMENMEALLPLIKQRFQNIENRLPIFIYKYFEPGVTDTNTGSVIRLNDKYMNQVISIEDDVVITSLAVKMNNEDITKQAYTGPFSVEILGRVEGEEASYLRQGDSYSSGEITPDAGWGIKSVRVQMGDDDITSEALSGHKVSVDDVMGDIAVEVETACEVVDEPFLSRITANGLTLANDRALIRSLHGNTLVWNQMVSNGQGTSGVGGWSGRNTGNLSFASDGSIEVNAKVNNSTNGIFTAVNFTKDHKYYINIPCKSYAKKVNIAVTKVGGWGGAFYPATNHDGSYKGIVNATVAGDKIVIYLLNVTADDIDTAKNVYQPIQVIDLTQMFGAGNEPTLAEFEALYPLGSYATDAGRLLDFKGETMRSLMVNAKWNQMVASRAHVTNIGLTIDYADGTLTVSGTAASNSTIAAYPRFTSVTEHIYYVYLNGTHNFDRLVIGSSGNLPTTLSPIRVTWNATTNAAPNLYVTSGKTYSASFKYRVFDLTAMFGEGNEPSTAAEFEAIMEKLGNPTTEEEFSAANLLQDITINPTAMYGYLNGEGEAVQIFPSGMRSAGSVSDEVYKEDGKWYAKVNVGSVELGELTWALYPSKTSTFRSPTLAVEAWIPSLTTEPRIVASKYQPNLTNNIINKKEAGIGIYQGRVVITDTAYTDADTFKDSLDNVMLNYYLSTPRTYLLTDEWQQTLNIAYQVETGGMEIILPENGSEPYTSPAKMAIQYGTDGIENN